MRTAPVLVAPINITHPLILSQPVLLMKHSLEQESGDKKPLPLLPEAAEEQPARKRILIVLPLMPFPLGATGLSLRYLPIIQHLSAHHMVDIIVIDVLGGQLENKNGITSYCRKFTGIHGKNSRKPSVSERIAAYARSLQPWSYPHRWVLYEAREVVREVSRATSGVHYDVAVCACGELYPYAQNINADRFVVDFVDSPTLAAERGVVAAFKWPWYQRYEGWKTRRWEAKIIRRAAASIFISAIDAQVVPLQETPSSRRYVIPNGISVGQYTSRVIDNVKSPSIGFLGSMTYQPNIEAAHWLYKEVFLALRAEIPTLSLYIIGQNPVQSIVDLGNNPGVLVTGTVEDIWPFVNAMDIFVFPMWKGVGLKNKVLQAMYAKRPVVTTTIGNEGIEAVDGQDVIVCDSAQEFQRQVLRLLHSPDERASLGENGYRVVKDRFAWDRVLRDFEDVITGATKTEVTPLAKNGKSRTT